MNVLEIELRTPAGRPVVLGTDRHGYWYVADVRTEDRIMCGFSSPIDAIAWAERHGCVHRAKVPAESGR